MGYTDNTPCLELIDGTKLSIFSLLNEECIFPKSTDMSWLQKLEANLLKNSFYRKPRLTASCFAIVHYAGEVAYEVKGFLEKNKDPLPEEIIHLSLKSGSSLVRSLLKLPSPAEPGKKSVVNSVTSHFRVSSYILQFILNNL